MYSESKLWKIVFFVIPTGPIICPTNWFQMERGKKKKKQPNNWMSLSDCNQINTTQLLFPPDSLCPALFFCLLIKKNPHHIFKGFAWSAFFFWPRFWTLDFRCWWTWPQGIYFLRYECVMRHNVRGCTYTQATELQLVFKHAVHFLIQCFCFGQVQKTRNKTFFFFFHYTFLMRR